MHPSLSFLKTEPVLAFLVGLGIFLLTLFLVVKRWIGFSFALILLIFALAAGFLISHHHAISDYMEARPSSKEQTAFQENVLQAIEELKGEFKTLSSQVEGVIKEVDHQKQKLQSLMDETNIQNTEKS